MRELHSHNPLEIVRAVCPEDLSLPAFRGIEWVLRTSWGAVGMHEFRGECFVHCQIWNWSRDHRRAAVSHWGTFLALARSKGYRRLFAVCEENDAKGYKFRRLFGFKDPLGSARGLVLFTQEI